jgi:hypothetical protein
MTANSVSDLNNINPSQPSPFKIYIACLTSYLTGQRYGVWVDAYQHVGVLEKAAQAMLATSSAGVNARNWIISDAEGFDPLCIEKFTHLKIISCAAAFLTIYGKLAVALLHHLSKNLDRTALEQALCLMMQNYRGAFKSKMDFIESEFANANVSLPKKASANLAMEEYWFAHYYLALTVEDVVHVFNKATSTQSET